MKTIKAAYDIAMLPPNKPAKLGVWGPGGGKGVNVKHPPPPISVNHEKLSNKLYTWIYLPVIVDFKGLKTFINNSLF